MKTKIEHFGESPVDRDGNVIPGEVTATDAMPGVPGVTITARIRFDAKGHGRCLSLEVNAGEDGPRVTSELLRKVRVADFVKAARPAAGQWFGTPEPLSEGVFQMPLLSSAARVIRKDRIEGARTPRKGLPMSDDHLRQVAEVYRDALDKPDEYTGRVRPREILAERFVISQSTASKWIRAARDRGFLGETVQGRCGEGSRTGLGESDA